MMSWNDDHKFTDVIFGITQKPLDNTSSNLVREYITNKYIFLLPEEWLVSFVFDNVVH